MGKPASTKSTGLSVVMQLQLVQFVERVDTENTTVTDFQRDMLMVNDDVFYTGEQQFNGTFFLLIGHEIKNVNPVFIGACQQVAGNDRLVTGFGFQVAFGFNRDDFSVRERYQPVRSVFDLILAEEGSAIAVYPPGSAFFLKNDPC